MEDIQIQFFDRVSNEEKLRDGEGQWAYRLNSLSPYGFNGDGFFGLKIGVRDVDKFVDLPGNC